MGPEALITRRIRQIQKNTHAVPIFGHVLINSCIWKASNNHKVGVEHVNSFNLNEKFAEMVERLLRPSKSGSKRGHFGSKMTLKMAFLSNLPKIISKQNWYLRQVEIALF